MGILKEENMEEDKVEIKLGIHIGKGLIQRDQIFRIKEEEAEVLVTMVEERSMEMMRIAIYQTEVIKRRVDIIIIEI